MNTVNLKEIQNFSKDSSHWWDINGPFRPLHRLNPVRLGYIKNQICAHFKRDINSLHTYKGLSILDIGCGGGLICEPMARLGATITGIDADENAIEFAKAHAAAEDLDIDYICGAVENEQRQFDIVLALEIIEHVDNRDEFVRNVMARCKPNGLVIFSTLNRTAKSFALGIIAAEYILGWVPKGTHNWKKFVKPSELSRMVRKNGGTPKDICGLAFNPMKDEFHLARHDLDVNYLMSITQD